MGFQAFAGGGGGGRWSVVGGGGLVVPVLLHYNARTRGALFLVVKKLTSQTPFCILVQAQGFSEIGVPTFLEPI